MLKLDYDDNLAAELGVSVEAVAKARSRAYVKIRERLRELGHDQVPETDEGLYLLLQRVLPGADIMPGSKAFGEASS